MTMRRSKGKLHNQHPLAVRHTFLRAFFEEGNIIAKWFITVVVWLFTSLWAAIEAQEDGRYFVVLFGLFVLQGIISRRFRCPYCGQPIIKRNTKSGFLAFYGPPGDRCAKCRSLL
jgi:hypothetical protein